MKKKIEFFNSLYENARISSEIIIYRSVFVSVVTLYISGKKSKRMALDYYIKNSKFLNTTFK